MSVGLSKQDYAQFAPFHLGGEGYGEGFPRTQRIGAKDTPFGLRSQPGTTSWGQLANAFDRRWPATQIDANYWTTEAHKAFLAARHDVGSWSLWTGKNFTFHQMFVDHCNAEYPERVYVEKTDRTVDEWRKRPGGPDNHLGDCLVMCLVAQAMLGLGLRPVKVDREPRRRRKRIKPSYAG